MASDQASASSKVSLLCPPLKEPSEYNTWRYILAGNFELEDATSDILNGRLELSETATGEVRVKGGTRNISAEDEVLKYKRSK